MIWLTVMRTGQDVETVRWKMNPRDLKKLSEIFEDFTPVDISLLHIKQMLMGLMGAKEEKKKVVKAEESDFCRSLPVLTRKEAENHLTTLGIDPGVLALLTA